jgi:alpha-tubulin suppressor-like RCC1 family protein
VCGDGIKQAAEVCDTGSNIQTTCPYGQMSCQVCTAQCQLVPGQLTGYCGDSTIQTANNEQCDLANLNNATCTSRAMGVGTLSCTSNTCQYSGSMCSYGFELAAGFYHSCGIRRSDRQGVCWDFDVSSPINPPANTPLKTISSGYEFSCGIRQSDSALVCWGQNPDAQMNLPVGSYLALSLGTDHGCAIRNDNRVLCWGDNGFGAATVPSNHVSSDFVAIASGSNHTCGILANTQNAVCWGYNYYGQTVPPNLAFKAIAAGSAHSCGLSTTHTAHCWGRNDDGQTNAPANVLFDAITAGGSHTCAIRRADGFAQCWGDNEFGQATPPANVAFDAISAGAYMSCGRRKNNGQVMCWGNVGSATPPTL